MLPGSRYIDRLCTMLAESLISDALTMIFMPPVVVIGQFVYGLLLVKNPRLYHEICTTRIYVN